MNVLHLRHRKAGRLLILPALVGLALLVLGTGAVMTQPDLDPTGPPGLSVGYMHACVVKSDGHLVCWGADYNGEVSGPNASADSFSQISAGYNYTCGLKTDGSLQCWGYDSNGQVSGPNSSTTATYVQVSAGYYRTCAVKTGGSLQCWGYDAGGVISGPNNSTESFSQVSAGGQNHVCAVKTGGALQCWGYGWYGEVSGPNSSSDTFNQVSTRGWSTCGLKTDGYLQCWGADWYGQVSGPNNSTAAYAQVSLDMYHACALDVDGYLACWGYPYPSISGPNASTETFVQVGTGYFLTCAMRSNGTVACWGYDYYGQATPPDLTPADDTPPDIVATVLPAAPDGQNGWYVSDVTVEWLVSDAESDITAQDGCDTVVIDFDTAGTTLTCSATSAGGSSSESVTIQRDTTPPVITYDSRTPANGAGWNNGDVTVNWTCADDMAGASSVNQTVSTEGAGQSATGTCNDAAGNTAQDTQSGINIDLTPPTLNPSVTPNPVLQFGAATADADAGDALSGLAVAGCDAVATDMAGDWSVACTATDNADNTATADAAYTVQTPTEATGDLTEDIGELNLPEGTSTSLLSKLDAAVEGMEDDGNLNNDESTINQLESFIRQVEAQRGKKIPEDVAAALIAQAEAIIASLES